MSDWKEIQAVIAELDRQSETMASTGAFWRGRFVELTADATQAEIRATTYENVAEELCERIKRIRESLPQPAEETS